MKTVQAKPADEMPMNAAEFDRIMGQALRVKPENVKKPKATKLKTVRKTKTSG